VAAIRNDDQKGEGQVIQNTKAAKAFAKQQWQREAKAMRFYGALFGHWRDCPSARCRRARACRGGKAACFRRWWRALSEEERQERRTRLRAAVEARVS
jgi:hypothetical protein